MVLMGLFLGGGENMKTRAQHIEDIEMIFEAAAEGGNFSAALKAKEMILKEQEKERKEAIEAEKRAEERAEKAAAKELTAKDITPIRDLSLDQKMKLIGVLNTDRYKCAHAFKGKEREEIEKVEANLKRYHREYMAKKKAEESGGLGP